jgi:hypothetical protein
MFKASCFTAEEIVTVFAERSTHFPQSFLPGSVLFSAVEHHCLYLSLILISSPNNKKRKTKPKTKPPSPKSSLLLILKTLPLFSTILAFKRF